MAEESGEQRARPARRRQVKRKAKTPAGAAKVKASPAEANSAAAIPSGFVAAAVTAPGRQAALAAHIASGGSEKGKIGLGIAFLVTGTFMFALQDATTKHLIAYYPISFIIMIRCWSLCAAGLLLLSATAGGIKANIKTKKPVLQFLRGLFVMSQWLLAAYSMKELGLGETTALYEAYPLFCILLAMLILHEKVGWRRWVSLIVGFLGILVMVRPGVSAVSLGTICALAGALLFAFYIVLTRLVSRYDTPQTSFFYMGGVSAALMLPALPFIWVHVSAVHIGLFVLLGLFCVTAHFCMIKALSLAAVTVLQPFNYSQLVWSILVGFIVFHDIPDKYTFIGMGLIVASGLFVLFRIHVRRPKIFVGDNNS